MSRRTGAGPIELDFTINPKDAKPPTSGAEDGREIECAGQNRRGDFGPTGDRVKYSARHSLQ